MKSEAFWQLYASSIGKPPNLLSFFFQFSYFILSFYYYLSVNALVSLQILHVAWICARTNDNLLMFQSSEAEKGTLLMFFLSVGGIIGSISQLWFIEHVGRKKSIHLLSIPLTVS